MISRDSTFCYWKFVIITFIITKYHKIVLYFFDNVAISSFHSFMFKNFIVLICLVYIVFLVFISCLLIHMLNYLLFLSMAHAYTYILWIY